MAAGDTDQLKDAVKRTGQSARQGAGRLARAVGGLLKGGGGGGRGKKKSTAKAKKGSKPAKKGPKSKGTG
jgi:hypothetical protein